MDERPQFTTDVEIDVGALLRSLFRKLPVIVVFAGLVAVGTFMALDRLAPVYKSEATILIESGESDLTRTAQSPQPSAVPDREAVASQIQLIRSRDVAEGVARDLGFASRAEFDETLAAPGPLDQFLARFGLVSPGGGSAGERVLKAYYRRLDVYAVDQSRVIGIAFSSTDPKLAAAAANAVADGYIAAQRAAKRDAASTAAGFLSTQITDLRAKVLEAESKVEAFRAGNDLFAGGSQSAATIGEQQLADLSSELARARSARAGAEAKAGEIRTGLQGGGAVNLADVLNAPLIQNLVQQQVALKSQIAQLSATYLPQHPRMKELAAQVADFDRRVAAETARILDSLDADARLARAREEALTRDFDSLKTVAARTGDASVELRALEREAAAQRELLDEYLRRYREATAREEAGYLPVDARVISRAAVPVEPDFPRKLPMAAAAGVAAGILAVAMALLAELASGRPMRRLTYALPVALAPDAAPAAAPEVAPPAPAGAVEPMPPRADPPMSFPPRSSATRGRAMPQAQPMTSSGPWVGKALAAIAGEIEARGARRIAVLLAEDSDDGGRPLAALTLARALAAGGRRVVLVDLHGDDADAVAMGEERGLAGLAELLAGAASFAHVIYRDHRSRVHLIPAGGEALAADALAGERIETALSALALTYDHVVLDCGEDQAAMLARSCDFAVVASAHAADDPRSTRASAIVSHGGRAEVRLLVVGPAGARPSENGLERASLAVGAAA
jgi:exopolysaccharide transport family protein